MDIRYEISIDRGAPDGCLDLRRQKYLVIDSQRQDLGLPELAAFEPGQFDELKAFAPSFEAVARAIWTPEVIEKWQEQIKVNVQ